MRTLRDKLILLLIVSALTPLTIYGVLSLFNAQRALKKSIHESFQEISLRSAGQIRLYITNAQTLLQTLAQDLANTNLTPTQVERIVENYVIRFPQFEKILLLDSKSRQIYSTSLDPEDKDIPPPELIQKSAGGEERFSEAYLSEDLTPVIWFTLPMKTDNQINGVLAAQIDLMQMWEWVSSTKLGRQGYASVVDGKGRLIASGDPAYKRAILSSEQPVFFEGFDSKEASGAPQLRSTSGGEKLLSTVPILKNPPWFLALSQPAQEAFHSLRTMTWELLALIGVTLGLMVVTAVLGSRRALLRPVRELVAATRALGKGELNYRIPPLGSDELGQLAESFNQMIADLAQLQETARRQERFAMFGRIASGLAHDLKHPVKNIENAAKTMELMYNDENYRATFTRIVQREFSRINHFLDDLRNLTHEMPFHPIRFNLRQSLQEIMESFTSEAENRKGRMQLECSEDFPVIVADPFLLRRVFENLISNALQALPPGSGLVEIKLSKEDSVIRAEVKDNGHGIPPEKLSGLFEEFMTTKSRGLGLGLAIAKKILELHQGTIDVESRVGKGTEFRLVWPVQAA